MREPVNIRGLDVGAMKPVREAGVSKGTLYVHFKNIEAVQMAVADELTQTFVNLLRPRRSVFKDPVERIADGCYTFLHQATLNPKWGGLVARYAWSFPTVGSAAVVFSLTICVKQHASSALPGFLLTSAMQLLSVSFSS